MWGLEDGQSYAWLFPSVNNTNTIRDKDYTYDFQIQYWHLYFKDNMIFRVGKSGANHITDVIEGTVLQDPMAIQSKMRPTDYLFWSFGLHDEGWWWEEPFTQNFFDNIHKHYREFIPKFTYPAVWVSMNSRCKAMVADKFKVQYYMMNTVNQELGERLKAEHLPYYDADLFLRTPENCNISGDGLHLKMWVDLYRARTFFNYLCDENNQWVVDNTNPFLL
jgi:hypothetical protein